MKNMIPIIIHNEQTFVLEGAPIYLNITQLRYKLDRNIQQITITKIYKFVHILTVAFSFPD